MTAPAAVGRLPLFLGFLRIGLLGLGGVAPIARHVIVEERGWLSDRPRRFHGWRILMPGTRSRPWLGPCLLSALLALNPARAAPPLRSFTVPPGTADAPAPSRAPRITVKPQAMAPLALVTAWQGRSLPFAYACSAAAAALVEPGTTAPPEPSCQGAVLVVPEMP